MNLWLDWPLYNKLRFRIESFSDRRILKGQYPYIGVLLEESDKHREPKFKAEMLAKYGRETGINPSVAWPTKEQVMRPKNSNMSSLISIFDWS